MHNTAGGEGGLAKRGVNRYKTAVRVTVLASGSAGNAVLVESGGGAGGRTKLGTKLLVDCGLPARELAKRFARSATGARLEDCVGSFAPTSTATMPAAFRRSPRRGSRPTRPTGRPARWGWPAPPASAPERSSPSMMSPWRSWPCARRRRAGGLHRGRRRRTGRRHHRLLATPIPGVAEAFASCDILVLEANHDPRSAARPAPIPRRSSGASPRRSVTCRTSRPPSSCA